LRIHFFFSSRRRHTRSKRDWSSDVCSSDLFENVRGTRFWESPNLGNTVRMMALQVALGAVMTTVAVRRLRPAFLNDESRQQNAQIGRASCRERGEKSGGDAGGTDTYEERAR